MIVAYSVHEHAHNRKDYGLVSATRVHQIRGIFALKLLPRFLLWAGFPFGFCECGVYFSENATHRN